MALYYVVGYLPIAGRKEMLTWYFGTSLKDAQEKLKDAQKKSGGMATGICLSDQTEITVQETPPNPRP
jgi:hypothetical protein